MVQPLHILRPAAGQHTSDLVILLDYFWHSNAILLICFHPRVKQLFGLFIIHVLLEREKAFDFLVPLLKANEVKNFHNAFVLT